MLKIRLHSSVCAGNSEVFAALTDSDKLFKTFGESSISELGSDPWNHVVATSRCEGRIRYGG